MRPGFYGDNAARRYPFVNSDTAGLPFRFVLDCGFSFAAYSGFDPAVHRVWLKSIAASGGSLLFTFATDAAEIDAIDLVFEVPVGSEILTTTAEASGTFGPEAACVDQLAWYGYLVTGPLADHGLSLPLTPAPVADYVEPGLLQNTDGSYVRAIHVANEQRTWTTDTPETVRPILVNKTCLQGPITFVAGYNAVIAVDAAQNGLVFSGAVGAGAGKSCEEVKQTADEVSPDGGELLSGGPRCQDLIRTINGVPGPRVNIRGQNGIRVEKSETDPHTLIVTRI